MTDADFSLGGTPVKGIRAGKSVAQERMPTAAAGGDLARTACLPNPTGTGLAAPVVTIALTSDVTGATANDGFEFVTAEPGVELAVKRSGEGPTVLLVGGLGMPSVTWDIRGLPRSLVDAGFQVRAEPVASAPLRGCGSGSNRSHDKDWPPCCDEFGVASGRSGLRPQQASDRRVMSYGAPEGAVPGGVAGFSAPPVVRLAGNSGLPPDLLGGKGYGIDVMRGRGLPVPPAFCITTEVCEQFFTDPDRTLDAVWSQVVTAMGWLEEETGRSFGRGPRPLLVSVRSGAAQSMPGMLDTVLNLGITDAVHEALEAGVTARFAEDTRRRFCELYRRIVLADDGAVPDNAHDQLRGAIEAVFRSWNSPRALTYRRHRDLNDAGGTAVVVQAMVFGNMDVSSGTGVLFSRNPMTGADEPFGEWLPGAQGEEVVSGSADCEPVTALRDELPAVYEQLLAAARKLEQLGRDVQEIEFTVEEGRLWLLQTRTAKRSAQAGVRLALRFRAEGLIDDVEALGRVLPADIETLLLPSLQPETRMAAPLLARGVPVCPGVARGRAYTDVDAAVDAAEDGEDVILVRSSTSPHDVGGMLAARGIVTEVGGATSHAAVVSREIGRPSVVGCGAGVAAAVEGKLVTVDGTAGEVREGLLELTAWSERETPDLAELADLARSVSPLRAHHDGPYPTLDETSQSAVTAAIAAGHTDVVSVAPLMTMLTALHTSSAPPGNPR